MLADILPTGYEVGVLNGTSGPATSSRSSAPARSACRPSSAPACTARATSSPSTWPTAGSRRRSSSAPTSPSTTAARTRSEVVRALTDGLGADVAIEAVGVPATFELADPAGPPRRARRQHRRPRRAGDPAPRGAVDQERHHHHRAGRHLLDPDPAASASPATSSTPAVRHPPLRAGPVRGGLRRVRRRGRDRRAEGRLELARRRVRTRRWRRDHERHLQRRVPAHHLEHRDAAGTNVGHGRFALPSASTPTGAVPPGDAPRRRGTMMHRHDLGCGPGPRLAP